MGGHHRRGGDPSTQARPGAVQRKVARRAGTTPIDDGEPVEPNVINGVDFTDPMTPAEVARMFAVDARSVTRWADEGRLSCVRTPGGHRRYSRPEVERLLRDDAMWRV